MVSCIIKFNPYKDEKNVDYQKYSYHFFILCFPKVAIYSSKYPSNTSRKLKSIFATFWVFFQDILFSSSYLVLYFHHY